MFKLLEKIAINFLIKRGVIKENISYSCIDDFENIKSEVKTDYYIREPAKIITNRAIQKKRFIKNFGIEINKYKDETNNK